MDEEENAVMVEKDDQSWANGVVGCVWSLFSFVNRNSPRPTRDSWEVPYESITDMKWIGSGAQGSVFSGKLNRSIVAVKKVKDKSETDIRHLEKLNHENIVKFIGVCTQGPEYCVIMEFCPYGSLYNLIHEDRPISRDELMAWATGIAKGMEYLHSYKIIHRDLKSPNILIGENHIVKVSDFGTSRKWNEISTKMSFAGTVAWMAPEVIRHERCSEKVDVYSYGVVLWELLTRQVPYQSVDCSAIIWGVGNGTMSLPTPTNCSSEMQLLVRICLDPLSKNRPTFKIVVGHLEAGSESFLTQSKLSETPCRDDTVHQNECLPMWTPIATEENDLVMKRINQIKQIQILKQLYEEKLNKINDLYMNLSTIILQLEHREKDIIEREHAIEARQCRCNRKLKPDYHRQTSTSPDIQGSTNNMFDESFFAHRRKTEFPPRKSSKALSRKLQSLNFNNEENTNNILFNGHSSRKDEIDFTRLMKTCSIIPEQNGNLKQTHSEENENASNDYSSLNTVLENDNTIISTDTTVITAKVIEDKLNSKFEGKIENGNSVEEVV